MIASQQHRLPKKIDHLDTSVGIWLHQRLSEMASVRARLEEVSSVDDESSSMAPYTTFNSLPTEDSLEQIRRKNTDINGDATCYQHTENNRKEKPAWAKLFKSRCFKFIDIITTVTVVSFIWIVMALPTGFFIYTDVNVS